MRVPEEPMTSREVNRTPRCDTQAGAGKDCSGCWGAACLVSAPCCSCPAEGSAGGTDTALMRLLGVAVCADLQVEVPERVIEGDKVTLTCKTTCSLTVTPTFTWYRNEHRLSSSTDQLHLQQVSSDNKDRYHCAVLGQNSPEVTVNVRYPPKNVSVSSTETAEGSSVNLTCSSDANPPVQNYAWFKEGGSSPVGSGHSYRALQSGFYYCVALNEHGFQKSAAVSVTVKGRGKVALYAVLGVFIVILFGLAGGYLRKKKQEQYKQDTSPTNAYHLTSTE
ncbi:hypothetical protein MHYP_G00100040 [Metynnis hypsauchen]